MSEISGFFKSDNHDRRYTDDFLAQWVASFIGNGVYNGELQVYANGDEMAVYLSAGRAWINGRIYINDSPLRIKINSADGVLNRYTAVAIRADQNDRIITAQALDSAFTALPVKPRPQRDTEIYDLILAYVYVPAGATAVRQADIADTRLNSDLCGIVACIVDHIDTDTLAAQMEDWFSRYKEIATSDLAVFEATFSAWFNRMKDQLSTDAAGNLQAQIDGRAVVIDDTATLSASGWSDTAPYTQTVDAPRMAALYEPIVDIVLTGTAEDKAAQLEAWSSVSEIVTGEGTITAVCLEDRPDCNIQIRLKAVT